MLSIMLSIFVIIISWVIIIWSVIEYIRRKRSEKEIMELRNRVKEVDRNLESIWKLGIIMKEEE